jgi:FKBP-type peptidyl-prolyl cis-trans isomerase FklB
MKIAFLTGLTVASCLAVQGADPAPKAGTAATSAPTTTTNSAASSVLKTDLEKLSYSIGLQLGSNLKQQPIEMDVESIIRGLHDGVENKTPLMNEGEIRQIQDQFRKEIMAKRENQMKEMKEKNQKEGEAFLAENLKKPGVKSFPDGLQYKVIKEGTGPKPKPTDRVAVNYRGTLINGTEFDSSTKHGPEPAVFGVTGVIKGWTEALTNMTVGSKWELYVPSKLAYEDRGSGRLIEPNSTLIFEVELVDIKQPEPPPQPVTSDIIKVPSKAELDAGAKIEVIKPEDLAKYTNKTAQPKAATTNSAKPAGAK